MTRTALVIGATGSFGVHATQALLKRGWRIRALARDPQAAAARLGPLTPIEWTAGDALVGQSLAAAARGADVIVHAANPPAYRNWPGTVLPMAENAIVAARAVGARLVVPGSVYVYAPDSGSMIGETAPIRPATRKGAIRARLEERLQEEAGRGLKSLVLRSGDFFGPASPNGALSWFVRRRGSTISSIWSPGPDDVGHAFAYTPDLGETLAQLLERESELADFELFHFRGYWIERFGELAQAISEAAGRKVPVGRFPWIVADLAAPFNETLRELREMRYLWRKPIGLANDKLVRFLGSEPHTPLGTAVAATLDDVGLATRATPAVGARDAGGSHRLSSAMASR
jgi:nucleoside-diphosphate-sugar epimerase